MEEALDKIGLFIDKYPYSKSLIFSVVLFGVIYVVKRIIFSAANKKSLMNAERIFLKKKISRNMNYLFAVLLIFLWFSHIQGFFVSILAILVSLVIAFKEFILCIVGGIFLRSSGVFREGHRIEVSNIRGFVLEKTFLSTKILEIGPDKNSQQTTGNIITIPNSLMLSHTIKNESYFRGYSIKAFHYIVTDLTEIESFEKLLLDKAIELSNSYINEAKRGINQFCEREGIIIPSVEPRTRLIIEDNVVAVLLKLPVRNDIVADIEQELNREIVKWKINHSKQ